MDNRSNMLQLCRLCLVKDDVNIPIFEEHGDIRQIFLKISSCLPVKVSREDKLPKKICDGCSFKLDTLYEFWNTSANAEKQLLTWLGEAGMNSQMVDGTISAVAQQIKPTDTFVKQETIEPPDMHTEDNEDDKEYMFQQKFEESTSAGPSATVTSNEEEEPPPPKRARRTAAVKAAIAMDHDSDDDDDSGEPMTKVEDESDESDGDDQEPSFADAPSTSADDQPGPSGVGKDGVEAPFLLDDSIHFICVSCLQTFSTKQELTIHEENVKEAYDCDKCQSHDNPEDKNCVCPTDNRICSHCKMSVNKENPKSHKCFHHTLGLSEYYRCDFCKTFCEKGHSCESPAVKCAFCESHVENVFTHPCFHMKTSVDFENLKENEEFTCDICDAKGPKKSFPEHYKKHTHVDCEICGYNFLKTAIRLHKRRRHKMVYCESCGKFFQNKMQYSKHNAVEHLPRICPLCGKHLASSGLALHMVRCRNEDPQFKCEKCGKRFALSEYLKRHMLVHSNERKHECTICKKKFKNRFNMMVHMRIHADKKPFECSFCFKTFTTKQWRDNHKKTHKAE